jgi:hypothetical protein
MIMKKLALFLFATILGTSVMAQEKKVVKEKEVVKKEVKSETADKKEIRKEVKMIEENGEKVLTISTTQNGVTTEEIYKGEAAEKKMAEIEKEEAKDPAKRAAAKKEVERKEKMVQESGTKNL